MRVTDTEAKRAKRQGAAEEGESLPGFYAELIKGKWFKLIKHTAADAAAAVDVKKMFPSLSN